MRHHSPHGWTIPKLWPGETVLILGGGPSLGLIDPETIPKPMIAVNCAYVLRPDADMLYFADRRWWTWNKHDLKNYKGPHIVSRTLVRDRDGVGPYVKWVNRACGMALSHDPRLVAGYCGGANAVNVAYLAGAKRIVLLGFDMRPGNWHNLHQEGPKPGQHANNFIPALLRMGIELKAAGVEVINATPGSALTGFPIVSPEEFGIRFKRQREAAA